MKKHIISIHGGNGSGKSSTADGVAERLEFKRFSSGDFFRKIGLDLGISLKEVSKLAETDPTIDEITDAEVRKIGQMDGVVIDSRLAFHWIKDSFKVYLDLPPDIAKVRILHDLKMNQLRQKSEQSESLDEVYQKIMERLKSEKKRYIQKYGVDHTDTKNFDLIIDTNVHNLEETIEIVCSEYEKWLLK